jgi:hypothetical protein
MSCRSWFSGSTFEQLTSRLGDGLKLHDGRLNTWFSMCQRASCMHAHPSSYPMGTRGSFPGSKDAGA